MPEDFYRIKRLPPYVFAEVNRLKAEYRAEGRDIIDFGMGNPDMDTPPHIVEKLIETVQKPRTHRYSASKGIPGLRRAQAGYYARRFGTGDPDCARRPTGRAGGGAACARRGSFRASSQRGGAARAESGYRTGRRRRLTRRWPPGENGAGPA